MKNACIIQGKEQDTIVLPVVKMYLEEVAKKIADETKKAAERMKNIHVTASVSYYQKNKT